MFLPGYACGNFFIRAGKKFCRDDDVFAPGEIAERPAEVLLAGPALISDGRVEKIDPQLQTAADDRPRCFFIDGPRVLPASPNPMQPMQMRETVRSEFPSCVYFIMIPPFFLYCNRRRGCRRIPGLYGNIYAGAIDTHEE